MLGRLWSWLFNSGKIELHVHVYVSPTTTPAAEVTVKHDEAQSVLQPQQVKKQTHRVTTTDQVNEMADMITAGGIKKAADKGGGVASSRGTSVEDRVSSLKQLNKG